MKSTGRPKKYDAQTRRVIAQRYRTYLYNSPRVLMAEYGISKNTLTQYTREFRRSL